MKSLGDMVRAGLWTVATYVVLVVMASVFAFFAARLAVLVAYTLQEFLL